MSDHGLTAGLPEGTTAEVVRPSQGRHTIDLIGAHYADGTLGLADVTVDGVRGEAIVLVVEPDPRDPDGEIRVIPVALVLDDDWFPKVVVGLDDEAKTDG